MDELDWYMAASEAYREAMLAFSEKLAGHPEILHALAAVTAVQAVAFDTIRTSLYEKK